MDGKKIKKIIEINIIILISHIHIILKKANDGAINSNKNVSKKCKWDIQILHIMTDSDPIFIKKSVNKWLKSVENYGFSKILISRLTGNTKLIF